MLAFPLFSVTPTEACPSYSEFWNYCHCCRVCKYMVPSLSSLTSSTFILSVRKLWSTTKHSKQLRVLWTQLFSFHKNNRVSLSLPVLEVREWDRVTWDSNFPRRRRRGTIQKVEIVAQTVSAWAGSQVGNSVFMQPASVLSWDALQPSGSGMGATGCGRAWRRH